MSLASQMKFSLMSFGTLASLPHMAQFRLSVTWYDGATWNLSGFDYTPNPCVCTYAHTHTQLDDMLASESREAEGLMKDNQRIFFQLEFLYFGKKFVKKKLTVVK